MYLSTKHARWSACHEAFSFGPSTASLHSSTTTLTRDRPSAVIPRIWTRQESIHTLSQLKMSSNSAQLSKPPKIDQTAFQVSLIRNLQTVIHTYKSTGFGGRFSRTSSGGSYRSSCCPFLQISSCQCRRRVLLPRRYYTCSWDDCPVLRHTLHISAGGCRSWSARCS
jgi:hypothetical protein